MKNFKISFQLTKLPTRILFSQQGSSQESEEVTDKDHDQLQRNDLERGDPDQPGQGTEGHRSETEDNPVDLIPEKPADVSGAGTCVVQSF